MKKADGVEKYLIFHLKNIFIWKLASNICIHTHKYVLFNGNLLADKIIRSLINYLKSNHNAKAPLPVNKTLISMEKKEV